MKIFGRKLNIMDYNKNYHLFVLRGENPNAIYIISVVLFDSQ